MPSQAFIRIEVTVNEVQIAEGDIAEVGGVQIAVTKVKFRTVDGGPVVPVACLTVAAAKPAASGATRGKARRPAASGNV